MALTVTVYHLPVFVHHMQCEFEPVFWNCGNDVYPVKIVICKPKIATDLCSEMDLAGGDRHPEFSNYNSLGVTVKNYTYRL